MSQIELNCVLMPNWIVWNRTVLIFNLRLTKLFEIGLFICIKMDLALNNLLRLICHKTKQKKKQASETINDLPVGWGCRIHWLHFCRGVRPPSHECPGYDTKQFDGRTPVMLELWRTRTTPSLSALPGPLWPGVVALDMVL